MGSATVVDIDIRIIKQDYRSYDLIARFWKGAYRGKIWHCKRAIESLEGDCLETVLQQLRGRVDDLVAEKRSKRANRGPSKEELVDAFFTIAPRLQKGQIAMLESHAQSKGRNLSLVSLKSVGQYTSTTAAMLAYADIGNRLMDELGYVPETSPSQDPAISLLVEATIPGLGEQDDLWTMQDIMADAIIEFLQ